VGQHGKMVTFTNVFMVKDQDYGSFGIT